MLEHGNIRNDSRELYMERKVQRYMYFLQIHNIKACALSMNSGDNGQENYSFERTEKGEKERKGERGERDIYKEREGERKKEREMLVVHDMRAFRVMYV